MENNTIDKTLELVPQSAIKQCYITDAPGYNAAWDYHITPDGRHFIPCCAEGTFPEYVRLYEYFPETNTIELKFKLDEKITVYPRTIRPSKFHTSMNSMRDGRMVMMTHTTASAPTHHCWMPEAYYGHMWEGFMGSNVLIYDPKTNQVEDLGIPVPRESAYGAKYIPEHNCIFFVGYYRGHAYRFNLDDRSVVDYGQCTEFGSYYLTWASDGNIYFTTRSGDLWRYNTGTMQPEYTGVELPRENFDASRARNVMAYSANGPDGKLYLCTHLGQYFYAYDPKTNHLEKLCRTAVPGVRHLSDRHNMVFGMVFDEEGMLWYTSESQMVKSPLRLCCVDITKPGAEPEDFGVLGTEHKVHRVLEGIYLKDGILYLPDANGANAPGVGVVDLKVLLRDKDQPRMVCQDPDIYLVNKTVRFGEFYHGKVSLDPEALYTTDEKTQDDFREYKANNPFAFYRDKKHYVAKLWKRYGPKPGAVKALDFDEDGNVLAYLDVNGGICVTVRNGEILRDVSALIIAGDGETRSATVISAEGSAPDYRTVIGAEGCASDKKTAQNEAVRVVQIESKEEIAKKFAAYKLPSQPGRQFQAKANAYGTLCDGSVIVGTRDGMVALIREGKVFSLGAVCNDGPIHQIAVSPDGRGAAGVAGDPSSLGIAFTYDVESGLHIEGFTYYVNDCSSREKCGVSCEPTTIAFSKDGRRLAIGVADQLSCIYEYDLEDH